MRFNAKLATTRKSTRLLLAGLALGTASLAPADSSWTKPSYGLEVYAPIKEDRSFWLGGLTASSFVKPARTRLPFLRTSVQGGLLLASGSTEGERSQVTPGLMTAGVLTLIHPVPRKIRPFIEGSLGFSYFFEPFPLGGSKVNGVARWGVGVEAFLNSQTIATLSLRRIHISNGGGIVPSNPSFDGAGLALTIRRRG